MRVDPERWIAERFQGAAVTELAGDASTRRFYRVVPASGDNVIVMAYAGPFEGETDDQKMAAIFERAGLPVAKVLESAPESGCLLLEDLGDAMLEDRLSESEPGGRVPDLLLRAAELAGRIATEGTRALAASDRASGPALDADRFCFEMDFFLENFVGRHRGLAPHGAPLRFLLQELAREAAETPVRVMCHRDYHSRNIMVTSRGGLALVDIQDARWGPDTYDLASLAFDAYVERPDEWVEPLILRYLEVAGINDGPLLRQRVQTVAAQRMIKALGTFGYQIEVGKNRRYEAAIPRTLKRLDLGLRQSEKTSAIHTEFSKLGFFEESL